MDLRDKVIAFLRSNPEKKAREIATALTSDTHEINQVLYAAKGRVFERLDGFRWRLISFTDQAKPVAGVASQAVLHTPLAKLCRYYIACLARDVDRDLSKFASSKYGNPDYAELSALPMLPSNTTDVWQDHAAQRLLSAFRKGAKQLVLFVGYPARLFFIKSKRSAWEGFKVEPLFVFEYYLDPQGKLELVDDRPDINARTLRYLTGAEGTEVFDEILQFQDELQFGSSDAALEESLEQIQSLRPEWPWRETMIPTHVAQCPPLSEIEQEGLYNRAILLVAERSAFTKGLEEELKRLESKGVKDYSHTALARWLGETPLTSTPRMPDDPLLEVLPLNTEQREAVRRTLSEPLTVITGPPGTGKSQVVTSIIVNCAWRGQKVLFASKTNKAVDVVEARVNGLSPRPVLLRLGGAQEYRLRLAAYLSSLLSASADSEDEVTYKRAVAEFEEKVSERDGLDAIVQELIGCRNRLDQRDRELEQLRRSIGDDAFRAFRGIDVEALLPDLQAATEAVARALWRPCGVLGRIKWMLVRRRKAKAASSAVEALLRRLTQFPFSAPLRDSFNDELEWLSAVVEGCSEWSKAAQAANGYFSLLDDLNGREPLESIAAASLEIDEDLAQTCQWLWNLWMRMQPCRLQKEERGALLDYKTLLDQMTQANQDSRRLGKKVFARFYDLFPVISAFLPAWAVTNLAARGSLPMLPGFFDLLIIDEASQCDIASVLPLLFRCKRTVILGDPKQLRHVTKVPKGIDQALMSEHGVLERAPRWSYVSNSLYDLASTLSQPVTLRDHFRSHADIIGFSNSHPDFYAGQLRIVTRYDRLKRPDPPDPAIRWVPVTGRVVRPARGGAVNDADLPPIHVPAAVRVGSSSLGRASGVQSVGNGAQLARPHEAAYLAGV